MEQEIWLTMELYLARDKSGSLYLYKGKPVKYSTFWMLLLSKSMILLNNSLFPEVKWEDEEPTEINIEIINKYQ